MTREEIAAKAEELRVEAVKIPHPGMSNYKLVLRTYKRILNDVLVLIGELAKHDRT
jgi:7,8-dihydro-6-hydroxymethylpterin-pyrophosphokinase